MKFKKISALFLCLTVLLALTPATLADGEIYFTAVNDRLLDLSDSSMPYRPLSGIIYIPASVFDSPSLGVSFVQNKEKMTGTLFNRDVTLTFDLGRGISYDKNNAQLSGKALTRNGAVFVPAAFVCQTFGLSYSYMDVELPGVGTAGVVRVKGSTAVLDDNMFSKSVSNSDSVKSRYDVYLKNKYPATGTASPSAVVSPTPSPTPQPLQRQVFLTFDDGPRAVTSEILDLLDTYGMKATFFVQGVNIAAGDDIIRRIIASGHAIGLHSYTHDDSKFYASPEAMLDELKRCNDLLEMIANTRTRIVRTPYGSWPYLERKPELNEALIGAGYRFWDWNVVSDDDKGYNSATVAANTIQALSKLETTAVVLMHDKAVTAGALPEILEYIASENYVVSTISESDRPLNQMRDYR